MTTVATDHPGRGNSAGGGRRRRWGLWPALLVTVVAVAGLTYFVTTPHRPPPSESAAGASTLVVGRPVPDFAATTLDGRPISLGQFRGRPVWLVFNATWCAGCRAEAPDLQAVHNEVGDDIAVLSVYKAEGPNEVRSYTSLLGLTFTHIPDPEARISNLFQTPGVPAHYFIDRNGVLRDTRPGGLTGDQMRAAARDLVTH